MSRRSSVRSAYARASARGVLLGALLSVAVIAPFAISAADPQPTTPAPSAPAAEQQPANTPAAAEPTPAAEDTATPEPAEPTAGPSASPESTPKPEPTAEPTPQPTTEPTVEPTPDPTTGPTTAPDPTPAQTPDPELSPEPTPEPTATPEPAAAPEMTEYLVTFGNNAAFAGRGSAFGLFGVVETQAIPELRVASVTIPADSGALAALQAIAGVTRVELARERTIETDPSDPRYGDQWALPKIGWTSVFGVSQPTGTAIVAVLDTGVDATHPDLDGRLVPGASFVDGATAATDPNGHGTHMAGIVAAATGNAEGIAGTAFDGVRVMPVTVLAADGTGSDAAIIAGIVWAVDNGADVISMSFSNPGYSPTLQAAIDYAWSNDAVVVAATGNDGSSTVTYPAGDRGVIGVSNTDRDDSLNPGSNYGDDTFLAAPGTDIVTTSPGGEYASVTGTSASAAMVAAAAGLLRAFDSTLTNGEVVYRLAATAADVAPVPQVGNGRLDLAAAVTSSAEGSVQPNGAGPLGNGGPIVEEPYGAALTCTWTGSVSSAWENPGNWSGCGGIVPTLNDSVIVPSTTNPAVISASTGTVAVDNITINSGVVVTQTGGTLEVYHDWKNSGTYTATGGTVQWRGSAGGGATYLTTNQFFNVVVDAGINPGFTNDAGSVISIAGNFTNNNTALPATIAATYVFNGSGAQSIFSAKTGTAATFGHLTVNKPAGTLSLTSDAHVTGVLTITAGTFDWGTFNANRATAGNGLTMAAGTTLRIGGSTGPANYTTSSLDPTSTVEYYSGAQSVTALTYGNLTLSGGGTKTAAAGLTIAGTFTIATATTFDAASFTHNFGGAFTIDGTFSAGTSTANFNGSGAQSIGAAATIAFNNLTITKTATTATLSNTVTVAGNLTVTSGTLDLGSFSANRTAGGGTLSLAAGATLKIGGTGGFPTNFTTVSLASTSTVEYGGTTQTVGSQSYGHLALSGGSTKTPAAGVSVAGDFTIASATTFAAGSFSHSFGGNFTNDGTFSPGTSTAVFTNGAGVISGTTATTFGAISVTTGVITASQSLSATSLTLENNGVANSFTIASGKTLTVSGDVTINQPATVDAVHALNINDATATVTGNVTLNATVNDNGRIARIVITTGTLSIGGNLTYANSVQVASTVVDMSGGAGTLNLAGSLTLSTLGTLTPGTSSTFNYNGTGAQTVAFGSAISYSTLKIQKPSGTATLGASGTVPNVVLQQGTLDAGGFDLAVTIDWTNNGGAYSGGSTTVTFSNGAGTISGSTATAFPNLVIAASAIIAMNNSNSASSLTFPAGATSSSLTHANGTTFSVTGAVTLNQPTASVTTAWNINGATVTTTGLITFAGTNTTAARAARIAITTGTLNADGGITFVRSVAASKTIDMSGGAGVLNLKGALTVPAASSTLTSSATSIFNYADSVAQTVNFFSAGAYSRLRVNNTSASGATLSAPITSSNVTGGLRVGVKPDNSTTNGARLDNGGFAISLADGSTFEVAAGATFDLTGTSGMVTAASGSITKTFATTSTVRYAGSTQTVSAESYGYLVVAGSGTKTLAANTTVASDLTVSAGTLDTSTFTINRATSGGTLTVSAGATLKIGGTNGFPTNYSTRSLSSTGTVEYAGTNQSVAGESYGHLVVSGSGTKTVAASGSVAGDLTVSAGILDLGSFTLNRTAAGGTLTVAAGATLKIGGTNGFPTNYSTRTLDGTSTVEYAGSGQTVSAETYGHLTLSGSGTKTAGGNINLAGNWTNSGITFAGGSNTVTFTGTASQTVTGDTTWNSLTVNKSGGSVTLAGNQTVGGNLTITAGTLNGDGATVSLTGNWSNSGTFTASTSTLTFTGAGTQTIGGSSATTFNHVTVNRSGGSLTLNASATVAGTLTFTSGVFATGANTLTASGSISGAGTSTGHVAGNLQKPVAASPVTFEIGGATLGTYTPITVTGLSGSGLLTASTTGSAPASIANSSIDSTKKANRTWTLAGTGTINGDYSVAVTFLAGDLDAGATTSTFVVNRLSGGTWTAGTSSSTVGSTTTTGGFNAGTFGEFAVGSEKAATKLAFVQQPGAALVSVPITPAVTVELRTSNDFRATFSSATIGMAIGTNPGGATLGGTTSRATSSGLATFDDLTLNAAGNGYTLVASASGLTNATSSTFNVSGSPGSCTSTGTGNWNATGTWTCGRVPLITDDVIITTDDIVTIPSGYAASAYSVTTAITNGFTTLALADATSSLTVFTNVTVNQPTGGDNAQIIVDAGTMTVGGNLSLTQSATNSNRCVRLRITTGTVTVGGNVNINNLGTSNGCGSTGGFGTPPAMSSIDMSGGAGTLKIAGSLNVANPANVTAGLSSHTDSVVDFNGTAAQTIPMPTSTTWTYSNLAVRNTHSSGATLGAAITTTKVTGNITVYSGGTLDNGGFSIPGNSGKTFTVQDGATYRLGGTSSFPTGFSTFVIGGAANSSTFVYYGGAQNIPSTATVGSNFDNLTLSGTSVTKTALGAITADARLTVSSSATFALGGFNVTVGSLTGDGVISYGSGGANTLTVGSDNTSTTFSGVINGTSNTTDDLVKTGSGTLILSGTSTYTGKTTVNAGTLSIAADANLGAAPGSATAGRLTFGGGTLATTATFTLNANRGIAFSSTGVIDVASSTTLTYSGIGAGSGGLTKTGAGILLVGGVSTYGGATTVSAGTLRQSAATRLPTGTALTVASGATFDLNSFASTVGSLAGAGAVTLGSATLTAGGSNASTSYSGTISGTGGLTKAGSGTFTLSSATSVAVGAVTISAGSIAGPSSGNTFSLTGAWTNNSSAAAYSGGTGTVSFIGSSSQAIGGSFATSFSGLTVNNSAGITLSAVVTVNGVLTLNSGNVTTGANNIYIANGGSVSRVSGHVVGNFRKYVATGATALTYQIGSASAYTPATVAFASVSVAGDLTASTTSSDHPNLATSLIDPAQSVNRYWTMTNSGVTFTTATVTLNWVAGDLDGGADTSIFYVDRYSSGWSSPTTGSRTSTSIQASTTAFGDFAVGESLIPVPGSLAASAVSTRRIDLTWTDTATGETGFAVEYGTDGVSYSPYTTTAANATGASVTGLSAHTLYYFRVRTVTGSGSSPWVTTSATTLAAPVAVADSYSTVEGVTLNVAAPGLLSNDPDGTNGFFTATKVTDPSNGSVTVNSNGSFTYTPSASFTGIDSFTYRVNDGGLQSAPATVTITVSTSAYQSSSPWGTSANASRYIELTYPAYLPSGATVHGATLTHRYRPDTSSDTVCYYVVVYESGSPIGTHGSGGSPISCATGTSFEDDVISLPEINTAARANAVVVRLFVWSSGGLKSQHREAELSVDYHLN